MKLHCSRCDTIKHHSEFHRNKSVSKKRKGYNWYCRPCNIERMRLWDRENKKRRSRGQRLRWYPKNYGITYKEFRALVKRQGYKCKVCRCSLKTRPPNLDHNHRTKKIRGVLCNNCNRGLGHFKDSIWNLKAAIKYLVSTE